MSIKRTIITTIVALALVAVVAPATASAALTSSQVQAIISLLQSFGADATTIANVQSSLTGGTPPITPGTPVPTGNVACAGVSFTRNLTVGSTGSDVKCLQVILNANGYTLAATGAGSPGMETSYFGPITLVAVKAFQTAHGWTPANQVGPLTRNALNALLSGTPGIVPTGPVSATLSYDNPATGALINSQATADLMHVNFTGSGTVTSVTLQRSGISDQNTLANVYLYDGAIRLTDGYSFNVSGQMVINGLNIAVNGSKVISVKADVASDALTYASSIAVTLTGYTANGTASLANVMGNMMMIVTGTPANYTVGTQTVGNANINAGTTQYTFWSAPLQINVRAVMLKTANFRMIGSAPTDALSNIRLFVDGIDTGKVATVAAVNGSNYAMFDLTSAPITLTTGSHTVDVRADVQKGTYRTVAMSLQQAADLTVTDPQIGVNVAATSGIPTGSGTISILQGSTVTVVDPTFTSQTDISGGASNAVIGRFTVHAYGEDIKVSSMQVTPLIESADTTGSTCTTDASGTSVTGDCGLNNVTLYFNGSQIGSQTNWTDALMTAATPITFSLGSQMIIPAGQDSIIEVRADLQTADNVAYTSGIIKVTLEGDADNAYGQSSQYTVGVPDTTGITTGGLTIGSGGLVVAKSTSFLNQSVNPNTANTKIGSYVIQNQSTSQSIRLTSLKVVTWIDSNATPLAATDITDLSGLRTSDTSGSGNNPIQPTGLDTFSVNDILAPGESMTLDIFANTGADANDYIMTKLQVTSIGAIDNIVAYYPTSTTYTTGQIMSLGTGTVATPTLVSSSSTPAQYISAGTSGAQGATQATFNFVSTSGSATITELKFTVSGTDASPSQTVTQICVGSVCKQPVAGTADLTGLSIAIPNGGGGATVNATVSYSTVGTGGIVPANSASIALALYKYTAGGTTTTKTGTTLSGSDFTSVSSPAVILVGSKPTVTVPSTSASGLIIGAENKIGEVTIAADAKGNIKLNDIQFTAGSSNLNSSNDFALTAARIAVGSTTVIGSSCGAQDATTASLTVFCEFATTNDTMATSTTAANTEYNLDLDGYTIPAGTSATFNLYATVAGTKSTDGSTSTIATSVSAAGLNWDDVSYAVYQGNGVAAYPNNGVNLTGSSIYSFPTNSYSVHD